MYQSRLFGTPSELHKDLFRGRAQRRPRPLGTLYGRNPFGNEDRKGIIAGNGLIIHFIVLLHLNLVAVGVAALLAITLHSLDKRQSNPLPHVEHKRIGRKDRLARQRFGFEKETPFSARIQSFHDLPNRASHEAIRTGFTEHLRVDAEEDDGGNGR